MELTYQLDDIDAIATQLLAYFKHKIIVFNGDVGAGKTTLIKALTKALGSNDDVSSPTFSLVNEYSTPTDLIYHFDLYRVNSPEELLDFGIEEYIFSENWCFIEWPENSMFILPENQHVINIKTINNEKRQLKIT